MATLSKRQMRGLNKLGDCFIPGTVKLPKFSTTGCAENVGILIEEMSDQDSSDLKLLLSVFSLTPKFLIVIFLHVLELSPKIPGPIGNLLRFMRLGMKGLVLSLYYSGKPGPLYKGPTITSLIGYNVGVYTKDL